MKRACHHVVLGKGHHDVVRFVDCALFLASSCRSLFTRWASDKSSATGRRPSERSRRLRIAVFLLRARRSISIRRQSSGCRLLNASSRSTWSRNVVSSRISHRRSTSEGPCVPPLLRCRRCSRASSLRRCCEWSPQLPEVSCALRIVPSCTTVSGR